MILAALKAAWAVLSKVPWQLYAVAVLALSFYGYGLYEHHQGYAEKSAEEDKKVAAQKADYDKQVAAIKATQQQVITKTVIEYRDRIQIVKEKGDEIVKEVQVLVPMDSPLLAGGVRILHDAAASGDMPNDPVGAAATAAPVTSAALLTTVATNYEACRANSAQLVALQSLVSTLGAKQ